MRDPQTTKLGNTMLNVKIPKIVLMILTSVFCLYLTGLTVADECWNGEGGGPTFTGNHNYPSGWFPEFQYDPNNPDEIDRNNSVALKVIGGTQPYTWSVSGNGFSLPNSTTARTNTLSADDTACGTATITITDNCGDTCTGYVRGTTGQWVQKSADCPMKGNIGTITGVNGLDTSFEYINGYQKQTHVNTWRGGSAHESCAESELIDCLAYCEDPPGLECEYCIDWDPVYNVFRTPCRDNPDPPSYPEAKTCYTNSQWKYYEWEC